MSCGRGARCSGARGATRLATFVRVFVRGMPTRSASETPVLAALATAMLNPCRVPSFDQRYTGVPVGTRTDAEGARAKKQRGSVCRRRVAPAVKAQRAQRWQVATGPVAPRIYPERRRALDVRRRRPVQLPCHRRLRAESHATARTNATVQRKRGSTPRASKPSVRGVGVMSEGGAAGPRGATPEGGGAGEMLLGRAGLTCDVCTIFPLALDGERVSSWLAPRWPRRFTVKHCSFSPAHPPFLGERLQRRCARTARTAAWTGDGSGLATPSGEVLVTRESGHVELQLARRRCRRWVCALRLSRRLATLWRRWRRI